MLDLEYVLGELTRHVYYLSDIYHSGHSGPEYTRKEGEKYDQRRHHYCILEPMPSIFGISMIIHQFDDEDLGIPSQYTITTPLVDTFEEDGFIYLRTVNSIYQLRIIRRLEIE